LSLIEQLDVVVGGERIQLDKAQQHVTIVTAGCRGQLQVTSGFSDFNLRRQYWNVIDVDLLELLIRAQPHYFRLGWIESQPTGTRPVIDVIDTRSETLHCH